MEDIGAHSHVKNTLHVPDSSDDDEDPVPRPKKSKTKRKSKQNTTVVESNESSDDLPEVIKKKPAVTSKNAIDIDMDQDKMKGGKHKKAIRVDSEIEEVNIIEENSEDELGKLK